MRTWTITAWKLPMFWASVDIEAETEVEAIEKARAYDWDDEPFEDCDSWPEPHQLRVEEDVPGNTVVLDIDLEPEITHAGALRDLLEEAESFITGFERDETQEGIDDLLERMRSVLDKTRPNAAPVVAHEEGAP
jgi:hypothetical protein